MKRMFSSRLPRCSFPTRTTATPSCIARRTGSGKISDRMCRGTSRRFIPISKCSTNRTRRRRRSPAPARSRAQRGCTTFTPETCTTRRVAAHGVPVAASCLLNAIGTSWANGIFKTVDVDLAALKSQDDSKSVAIGVRGGCRSGWRELV